MRALGAGSTLSACAFAPRSGRMEWGGDNNQGGEQCLEAPCFLRKTTAFPEETDGSKNQPPNCFGRPEEGVGEQSEG